MSDAIVVWYTAPATWPDGVAARLVTPEESARARRFRHPADAAAQLVSRALLRAAISAQTGIAPLHLAFDRRCRICGDPAHGRPVLAVPHDGAVEFSLTHTRSVVAVALGADPVGLDAEPLGAAVDDAVHSEVFSDADRAWLASSDAAARARLSLALWVGKEAIGKASGHGIVDAATIRLQPSGGDGWQPAFDARGDPCIVRPVDIPGTAAAAIATYGAPRAVRVDDARELGLGLF